MLSVFARLKIILIPGKALHGLKMLVTPKNATAAKKGVDLKYRLQASDYYVLKNLQRWVNKFKN